MCDCERLGVAAFADRRAGWAATLSRFAGRGSLPKKRRPAGAVRPRGVGCARGFAIAFRQAGCCFYAPSVGAATIAIAQLRQEARVELPADLLSEQAEEGGHPGELLPPMAVGAQLVHEGQQARLELLRFPDQGPKVDVRQRDGNDLRAAPGVGGDPVKQLVQRIDAAGPEAGAVGLDPDYGWIGCADLGARAGVEALLALGLYGSAQEAAKPARSVLQDIVGPCDCAPLPGSEIALAKGLPPSLIFCFNQPAERGRLCRRELTLFIGELIRDPIVGRAIDRFRRRTAFADELKNQLAAADLERHGPEELLARGESACEAKDGRRL